ncbi:MAG: tRNA lysidine(34) synthetase TilS, partial [Anaerolineae bacterium]
MTQVIDRVRHLVEEYGLLEPGETVVVGVSGGPDSLCLLHLLCRLAADYDLDLHVAHLHHGLRGSEADDDAQYVRTLAADWRLPVSVERLDLPALAADQGLAFEEAARRARYAFLGRVAQQVGARTIAVGHNADDQAETVLMHWIRGSGLAGLRGMLPRTSLAHYRLLAGDWPSADLDLVRPLLEIPRADIETYVDYYGLQPRFDRSNLDTTYFRNWLRHEVIPLLEEHNPNLREVIRRSAQVLSDEYALLRNLLAETWPRVVLEEGDGRIVFDLAAWRELPTGLQRSTLREAIHRLRHSLRNINFVHVENALHVARDGTSGNQATLPRGLVLALGYERFTIAGVDAPQPLPDWPLLRPGTGPQAVRLPGSTPLTDSDWLLRARLMDRAALPPGWEENRDPWRAFLDARRVHHPRLRTRRPGDRFQPLGMGGHSVKVADFLTNAKVPRAVRDRLPLLVADEGLAWICGHRLDE